MTSVYHESPVEEYSTPVLAKRMFAYFVAHPHATHERWTCFQGERSVTVIPRLILPPLLFRWLRERNPKLAQALLDLLSVQAPYLRDAQEREDRRLVAQRGAQRRQEKWHGYTHDRWCRRGNGGGRAA